MKVAAIYLSERSFPRYFNPNGLVLKSGDICIVEDSQVVEAPGKVAVLETRCEFQTNAKQFPRVLRLASTAEIEQWRLLRAREIEAMGMVKEASRRLNLEMKISTVRFDDRQRRVIFNFTAEQRVDFRQLVRELASGLKSRIELWQIGVRDESKTVKGCGVCGQHLCCATWIKEFKPVSIRQAKDQDLMLSPAKLSGQCGRLLCCLTYEHEHYRETARKFPSAGILCRLKSGEEVVVVDRNLLVGRLLVRDQQGHTKTIQLSDVETTLGKASSAALKNEAPTRGTETPVEKAPAAKKEEILLESLQDEPAASQSLVVSPDKETQSPSNPKPEQSRKRHFDRQRQAKFHKGQPSKNSPSENQAAAPSQTDASPKSNRRFKPRRHNRPSGGGQKS